MSLSQSMSAELFDLQILVDQCLDAAVQNLQRFGDTTMFNKELLREVYMPFGLAEDHPKPSNELSAEERMRHTRRWAEHAELASALELQLARSWELLHVLLGQAAYSMSTGPSAPSMGSLALQNRTFLLEAMQDVSELHATVERAAAAAREQASPEFWAKLDAAYKKQEEMYKSQGPAMCESPNSVVVGQANRRT